MSTLVSGYKFTSTQVVIQYLPAMHITGFPITICHTLEITDNYFATTGIRRYLFISLIIKAKSMIYDQ